MKKWEMDLKIRELKDELEAAKEAAKEPIKYIAVTVEPRTHKRFQWRRNEESEYVDTANDKLLQTVVLIRRDGIANTITFPGKWTLAQIKAAANG